MAKNILKRLWRDQKATVEELLDDIQDNYTEEEEIKDNEVRVEKLHRELERLQNRRSNLVDMKLDDLIGKQEFESKNQSIEERMQQVKNELAILSQESEATEPVEIKEEINKIKEYLNTVCDLDNKKVSDELIDSIVTRITPMESGVFKWYIQSDDNGMETSFDESKYILYDKFTLNFEEAKAYRKSFGNFIRFNQWKDIVVEVYVRQE